MEGLAGPLEPGIRAEEHLLYDGHQGFGFLLRAIGFDIDRCPQTQRGRKEASVRLAPISRFQGFQHIEGAARVRLGGRFASFACWR